MKQALGFIALIFLLLTGSRLQAQVYPVSGNSVLIPPYSVYLADYAEGTSDRLVMNLVLNDVSRPELRVRLRLKIMNQSITLETKPEYIGHEIVLEGGVPLRLTGFDLAEYFNPNNLNFSGISKREFEKTGALPADFYHFCFEVLEYNRGVRISNSICANGWIILNDPPLINLPRNGEKLAPTQPQNIVFQWTPRHTGSPNSAFSTEYDIKLVELWPSTRNPNDAILSSPPILEETTRGTTFIYDVSQTPLELGRHYALQIKAKGIVGADELDLFKNNGKSEVVTFVYGDPCNVPQNILAEATSATRFKVNWTGDFNHTAYSLRYRLANTPSAQWYTSATLVPDIGISALQPNTLYEFQMAGGCGVFESVFSSIAQIKTFDTGEQGYSCGMPLEQFNLDPANLLDVLKVGDVIQAGDFDVKIAKVSGSNGTFTGEGVIEVPFFNKASVKAEFANIVVNKEMRMVNGYMNVTGVGVEVIPSGVMDLVDQLDETLGGLDTALMSLEANRPQPFDPNAFVPDVTLNIPGPVIINTDPDGTVIVTDATGKEHTLPSGTEAAIVDDKGNATFIDSKGKEHSATAAQAAAAINREYNLKLKFTKAPAAPGQYGFDSYEANEPEVLQNRYTKLDGEYFIPYKSVETGHTDAVVAILDGSGIDKSKIRFEMGGVPVPVTPFSGDESTVTVSSKSDGEEEGLIAIFSPEDDTKKDQVLGRVNVVTYDQIRKTVYIVPVNGNDYKLGDATSLQRQLNAIYGQAVVNWSVVFKPGISDPGISPFDVGSTGMLTNYTDHMKQVINAYKANMENDENTYYLFLVNTPSDPKINGFMPRSKQAGFIFYDKHTSESAIARTMAHELGHGAFNLHHTFMEENFSVPEGKTDNLMDYAGGVQLYKYQWDMMRYPPIVMGLFEWDDEAQSVSETDLEQVARIINSINCGYKNKRSSLDIYYGATRFEVNLGKLASMLNSGAPIIASEEFKRARLIVWFGGYFINEPFLTYNDLVIKLNDYKYVTGDKITIPGVQGGVLGFQVSDVDFRAPLKKTDVFDWLILFLNRDGAGASPCKIDNSKQWKAEDLFILSECDFVQLSRANREKLIPEIISNQEYGLWDQDTYQYLLINLLKYTPPNDQAYFYEQLVKNPKWILYPYDVMDLDQRHKFVELILGWWSFYGSANANPTDKIVINYSIFSNPDNLVVLKDNKEIEFKSRGQNNIAYYVPEGILCTLKPFEELEISFKDQSGERKVTRVPAILVKYMVDKGFYQDLKDMGWTTLNIASLITGVGEIGLAVQTYRSSRFILGSFRLLLATGNVFSSIASTYCTQGRTTTEFCQTWAQYEVLLSVGLLSASALDQFYVKLSKAYADLPPGSFTAAQKELLEGELGLADNVIQPIFKIGDEIIGISIKQVKSGKSRKFAIIGRSMGNLETTGVRNVYSELRNVGKLDVEIFDDSSLKGTWKIRFEEAKLEFSQKTNNWTTKLSNQELLQLKMYKLNKDWAQHLVDEGYTVLDMGDFNNLGFSAFYAMEKATIFK